MSYIPKTPKGLLFFIWYYHWSNFLFHWIFFCYHWTTMNSDSILNNYCVTFAMAWVILFFPLKYSKSHLEQTSTNRKCPTTTNSSRCSMRGKEDLYTWWNEFHRNCIRWRVFFRYRLVHQFCLSSWFLWI